MGRGAGSSAVLAMSVAFAQLRGSRDCGLLEQHQLFLSFFEMLIKPSEESGSSQPKGYGNCQAAAIQTQSNPEVLSCCFYLLIVHLFHGHLGNAIYDGKY